ncbi:hypothetical protein LSTR_LSTR013977 [Laodelphax striatellus]|uniref:Uncharacterized protein n=1 Tax=Laodelphax striatellus TaxID=195883 RepID=A0A482XHE6_LAOST|nr:hypothetical protein LSTR_LSTR013977 [Laodelphax striatellus]
MYSLKLENLRPVYSSIESDKLQGDWHALAGRNRCSQRSAIMEKREGSRGSRSKPQQVAYNFVGPKTGHNQRLWQASCGQHQTGSPPPSRLNHLQDNCEADRSQVCVLLQPTTPSLT